jgi:hypothetical protein
VQIGAQPAIEEMEYKDLFTVAAPDVTLRDNNQLSRGSLQIAEAFATLQNTLLGKSPTLHRIAADLMLKFAGEPQEDDVLDKIVTEAKADPIMPVFFPGDEAAAEEGEGGEEVNHQP